MARDDWARYWRSETQPLEAMHAHFRSHVYHRHSHETYSFGVTEDGAQAFGCRDGQYVSSAGMVMAFNPDDPHDGHAATESGFTYRMVHVGPGLLASVMTEIDGRHAGLPLFPVRRISLAGSAVTMASPRGSPERPLRRRLPDRSHGADCA